MRFTRLCAMLLALCLTLSAGTALAQDQNLFLSEDEDEILYPTSMIWGDGTLYMLSVNGSVYAWKPGQEKAELWAKGPDPQGGQFAIGSGVTVVQGAGDVSVLAPPSSAKEEDAVEEPSQAGEDSSTIMTQGGFSLDQLLYDQGQLYGLDSSTGILYRLGVENGNLKREKRAALDWDEMKMTISGYAAGRDIGAAFIQGDSLYLTAMNDNYIGYALYAFHLETGACRKLPFENVSAAAPSGEGKVLLAVTASSERPSGPDGSVLELVAAGVETGETTLLCQLPVSSLSGLSYQPATGLWAFVSEGKIYTLDQSGKVSVAAYAPIPYSALSAAWMDGYAYAAADSAGIYIRDLTPGKDLPKALTVIGQLYDDAYRAFSRNHPEVPLSMSAPTWENGEDLMMSMAGGGADVYLLPIDQVDFNALKQKGYAAPIESALLSGQAASMYPWIQEALQSNGALVAFPQSMDGYALGYDPDALALIGLTEDDLPQTLPELIQFIEDWEDLYQEKAPDLKLFDSSLYERPVDFFGKLLFSLAQSNGLAYDSPLFASLAGAVASGNYDAVPWEESPAAGVTVAFSESVVSGGKRVPSALFTAYQELPLPSWSTKYQYYKPLPLALENGQEAKYPVSLMVFIVNPYSNNQEGAIAFLESMAEYMSQNTRLSLMPGESDPVPNPYYEETIDQLHKALEQAKADYDQSLAEEKKWKQDTIAMYEQLLEDAENAKWNISSEDIAAYRKRAEGFTLSSYQPLSFSSEEVASLWQRLLSGQLTPEQFGKTLQQKDQMMRMEAK